MSMGAVIPLGEGFLLGMGLIVGIGPQNSFILQQAMRQQFVFMMIVLASLIDIALIVFGAGGAAQFFATSPSLVKLISWIGAAFLLIYGWKSFCSAVRPEQALESQRSSPKLGRGAVFTGMLAVSLLNPSTYLDTMLVIGSSAATYDAALRLFFTVGASLASLVWFFSLACGAAKFAKLLANPVILRMIDSLSGLIMWFIAIRLLMHTVSA